MNGHFFTSLTDGDFGNGFPLRQSLLDGDFWPRLQGCYNLYRGMDRIEAIDYERIVLTQTSKGAALLPAALQHAAGTDTFYAVRCASVTGKEERGTMATARLSLDGQGVQLPLAPRRVRGLQAAPTGGGQIRLTWWYWPLGQRRRRTILCCMAIRGAA